MLLDVCVCVTKLIESNRCAFIIIKHSGNLSYAVHNRRPFAGYRQSLRITLTAVFGFIGLVGTISTDVTNAMVGYARQVIGTHEMRVFGTTPVGYACVVF